MEIPLGSGARELGLRPSIFVDVGSVFGISSPPLTQSPLPDGLFIPQRNSSGLPLYTQIDNATVNAGGTCSGTAVAVTNPVNPAPGCLANSANAAIGTQLPPFQEEFYGNSAKPRLSIGIGVNWNSPFGPFRIDIAHALLSAKGDQTKLFSFNVGTQF